MCELAFIEYNLNFDSIMPFPCHNKNFKVIFNNCHLLMTLMIGLHHFFLEMSKNVGQDSVSGIVHIFF
jgi:hypothetical protein